MKWPIAYRHRLVLLLFFLAALTYLDRICISIVGIRIKSDLHLTNTQFGWVLGAFALAYALFEVPAGWFGDRIGPRNVFLRIVIWWSVFTALTGVAGGLFSLIAARFLFGMGEAGTYPNSMIAYSRWLPRRELGRGLAWLGIGSQVGSAIAPLLVVPLAMSFGWRMPFFVNALLGLVWAGFCFAWFRNEPENAKGISAAELALIRAERRPVAQEQPVPWKSLFRSRNLFALMLMYFCSQAANYFFIAWMPVYLQEARHFSESGMKRVVFCLFVVGTVGFLAGGAIGDRLVQRQGLRKGRRGVGITGLGGCGLLILLAGVVPSPGVAAGCLIAANGFFSFGVMMAYGTCIDIGGNASGTVTGAMNFAGQIGAFLLALLFGKVADLTHSLNKPLFALGLLACAGALLWRIIDPEQEISQSRREGHQLPA
jgi:MFS family permease